MLVALNMPAAMQEVSGDISLTKSYNYKEDDAIAINHQAKP